MATAKKGDAKGAAKSAVPSPAQKNLKVSAGRNAKLAAINTAVKHAFGQAGCAGCRSGFDRITFQDKVIDKVK